MLSQAHRNYAAMLSDEPHVFMRRPTPRLNILNPNIIAAVRDSAESQPLQQPQPQPQKDAAAGSAQDDAAPAPEAAGSSAALSLFAGLRTRAASLVSSAGQHDEQPSGSGGGGSSSSSAGAAAADRSELYFESDPFVTPHRDGRSSHRDSSFSAGRSTISGDAGRGSLESVGRSRSKNMSTDSYKTPVIFSHTVRQQSISALRRATYSRGLTNELSRELSVLVDSTASK